MAIKTNDMQELEKETDIERFTRLVVTNNIERIEYERDKVGSEHLKSLVELYWTLEDWEQKGAIVDLVQDTFNSLTRPIMLNFLNAPPDQVGDYLQTCKIIALCHLEGNFNNFSNYYKNRELIQPTLEEYLKLNK
jgi:hypothetical protein